ncbi:MAG: DUF1223 domain-containing protein [Robiginitomaculum sp.]|nr:DUF1223 domain-containing protein [Robiginitomaculum sp.]
MIKFLLAPFIVISLFSAAVTASEPEQRPVLVELFTSQGCANCPGANEFLAGLSERKDVIAISLAVDYWDYLGWKDTYAMSEFTKRQAVYGKTLHTRRPYTPQVIINGQTSVKGTRKRKVLKAIKAAQKNLTAAPEISFVRLSDKMQLSIGAGEVPKAGVAIIIADYMPGVQHIEVTDGDNSGKTLDQVNMVTKLHQVGVWNGEAMVIDLPLVQSGSCVVILQEAGQGKVLAAGRLQN